MKAIVRDDIIALDSFVAAEFKYKEYLELLMKCGNYCFLDQFKKLIPSGGSIVNGMIENNLLGTENVNNNYKYIYLSDTAMKYLYLGNSEEDFSQVKKNRISVKKVNKNPSEKQLLSSAYKFHLLSSGEEFIDKESIMKEIRDYILIKRCKGSYDDYLNWKKNKEIRIEELKEKIKELVVEEKNFDNSVRKLDVNQNLFDFRVEREELKELTKKRESIKNEIDVKSSGIVKLGLKDLTEELKNIDILIEGCNKRFNIKATVIKSYQDYMEEIKNRKAIEEAKLAKEENHYSHLTKLIEEEILTKVNEVQREFEKLYDISKLITRIKDNKLEFIILDTGNFKTSYGYLKQINSLGSLSIGYEKVKIIIYSYAQNRAENLYNEFIKVKKDKEKALDTMRRYNLKTENSSTKSDFYIAAKKIYDNTPDFEIEIKNDFYYMKSYKELLSSTTKSIKRKDRKAIDDLIEKLKK